MSKVYLIGAGPGDEKLITLKGFEILKKADVIVYDRLANPSFLEYKKDDAKLYYVGKQSSNHYKTQDEINDIICECAKEGKIVARLKGGDPYVFGRGAEEAKYLLDRGIDFEVVPGITSAIGGLAYAGIPITHRDYSSSFHVFTGHFKDDDRALDYDSIVKLNGTLVFLMGMKNLSKITKNLIQAGKNKDTKVAIINWATRTFQKTVTGTLETIEDVVIKNNMTSPSLIVVGDVVNLREELNFFESKLLFNKNILVTRARKQASKLSAMIKEYGGNPIEIPAIKIEPITKDNKELEESINKLNEYSHIIFTSVNGVKIFMDYIFTIGKDIRCLSHIKFCVIGKATKKELENYHINADIMPKNYVAEDVIEEVKKYIDSSSKILMPRAKEARTIIKDELEKLCQIDEIKIYKTIKDNVDKENVKQLLKDKKIDYITFASSSTVKNFVDLIDGEIDLINDSKIISIGPITSDTIKNLELNLYKEADEYTIDGVFSTIIKDL